MNDLWIIGVLGGGAGVAIGGPMVVKYRSRDEPWTLERLVGLWIMGAAITMMLIAMRHGRLLSPGLELFVEHLTNALSLVAWPFLLTLTRRFAGLEPGLFRRFHHYLLLPAAYTLIIALLGGRDIRFVWLLPVSVSCAVAIGLAWIAARRRGLMDRSRTMKVGAVVLFSLAFVTAQTTRSLFPHVLALREIVPVVFTICFLALGHAVIGATTSNTAVARRRYEKSGLTAERAESLIDQLDRRMQAEGWYREPGLSLGALAARLDVTPHALSQALNQKREQSLMHYLVEWRVREAKRLLVDDANDCFTVEAIATRSGFASRSAFYKAFALVEGTTPTEYRRRIRAAG